MELRLLGSGGWIPTPARETCCMYVREGSHVVLVDAGTGVSRLVSEPELLEGVEQVSVLLTHFHLDHTIGLAYIPAVADGRELELWAPGRVVAGMPAREVLHRLLAPPLFAVDVDHIFSAIHEVEPGPVQIAEFSFETRVQPLHSTPTLAVRMDGIAYCTDTAYDPDNSAFAQGASVLLHEAFYGGEDTDDRTHSTSGQAATIAEAAGVGRLVLVHVNPRLRAEEELLAAARSRFAATEVGRDGPL